MNSNSKHFDIEIDKLTNSIENRISGEVFDTEVQRVDPLQTKIIKKKDWRFDWRAELKYPNREVYKLTTIDNPSIIQGLISLGDNNDHIFMHLIESVNFNIGKSKLYLGVPGNLVAFACKCSFEAGYSGFIGFLSKSRLIDHYKETLNAEIMYGNYMSINTKSAMILINKYYNK